MKHWDLPILDNPVRRVPRPQADDKPRKERWPDSDVDKIYKAVGFKYGDKPTEMRHRICYALSLAVETAMRCGEICMVTKNDFGYELDEKGYSNPSTFKQTAETIVGKIKNTEKIN